MPAIRPRVRSNMPRPSTFLSLSFFLARVHAADSWHVSWPSSTYQCQNVQASITGGTPPWDFVIVPVGQQPLFWTFYDPGFPVNASNPATATIPLQLEAGTPYSVAVADARDWNRALFNPTTVQVVQSSNDSSCFASAQPAHKDFSFQVYGKAAECERQFGITWTTNVGVGPYTFTVIPMDGSYTPWNVLAADEGATTSNVVWQTNMTAGTRFTIYMNDGYGGGRGGAGQIWEVAAGDNPSDNCISAEYNGRGTWPSGVTVAALQAAPTPFNSTQTSINSAAASSDGGVTGSVSQSVSASAGAGNNGNNGNTGSSSSDGGLSKGAIAGIAVGAAVGVAILIGLIWLLFARRRKRARQAKVPNGTVDLADDDTHGEPKVEPYRGEANGMPVPAPTAQRDSSYSTAQSQNAHELGSDHPGFAGLGAGALAGAGAGAAAGAVAGHGNGRTASSPPGQSSKGYEAFHALNSSPSPTTVTSPTSPMTGDTHGLPPGAQRPLSPAESGGGNFGPAGVAGVAASVSGSSDSQRDSKRPLPPVPGSSEERALPSIPSDHSPIAPTREDSGLSSGNAEFRRHTDAGEYNDTGERGVVDLPPLYTDVPRRQGQGQSHGQP